MVNPTVTLVAAVAKNRIIGAGNRLIWRLKSDMKHFRALTMGKALVMGRKTFESIGKPLPGRHTIVLTRDPGFVAKGVRVARSTEEALTIGRDIAREIGADEIMIAGGGEIYAAFMSEADRLEITEVALEPEGDAWFPEISPTQWREETRRDFPKSADDEASFAFISYVRR
ncbi:MAG TPA: dihydrofolate reductase [Rhabdaerophilum sp.]|nr:dihydrofolate reductase [Rhabdaerophilum sp.]